MKLKTQKQIKTKDDIFELGIIDFNRLNGVFQNPNDALNTIFSWYELGAIVSIIDCSDIWGEVKTRNDFPGWKHVGTHVEVGKKYWDFFWANFEGLENTWLQFSDSPDFQGAIEGKTFWGDIGQVSASAFAISQKQMDKGSLWITIIDNGNTHVLIESLVNIVDIFGNMCFGEDKPIRYSYQLSMFGDIE
jgi:hypothetical protein